MRSGELTEEDAASAMAPEAVLSGSSFKRQAALCDKNENYWTRTYNCLGNPLIVVVTSAAYSENTHRRALL
jgi:hypothetical protein